jgi:flagellar basal body P-ring formation protein FlgA
MITLALIVKKYKRVIQQNYRLIVFVFILSRCACNMTAAWAEDVTVFTTDEIVQAAKDYIYEHVNFIKEDILIEIKTPPESQSIAAKNCTMSVRKGPHSELFGYVPIDINFVGGNNDKYKTIRLYADIDMKVLAFVAKQWIKRFEPFTDGNIMRLETLRSKLPPDAITDSTEFTDKVAKVGLSAQKIITRSNLDYAPIIRNKELVTIIYDNGSMKIIAKGVALSNAKKGEMLRLRVVDTNKEVYGKVLDSQTVSIQ